MILHLRQNSDSRAILMFGVLLTAACLSLSGCRDNGEGPQIISLEGKVEKIELNSPDSSGKITVIYYNEKQRQELPATASLTPTTEVMINGAVGALRDIHPGEKIRGEVRVDKKPGESTPAYTVLKIRIDRPKTESKPGG